MGAKRKVAPTKTTAIVKRQEARQITIPEAVEKVLLQGDLSPLNTEQRLDYYKKVCLSLGLNPLTRPLEYIALNNKLTLYARKDCTDQLRHLHGVGVTNLSREYQNDLCLVTVQVQDRTGRTDAATGAVPIKNLAGAELANAIMKAETKAKRRATLSLCGLGMLDESELDAVAEYGLVTARGRVYYEEGHEPQGVGAKAAREVAERKIAEYQDLKAQGKTAEARQVKTLTQAQIRRFWAVVRAEGWKDAAVIEKLKELGFASTKDIPDEQYDRIVETFVKGKPKPARRVMRLDWQDADVAHIPFMPKPIEEQAKCKDYATFLREKKVWIIGATDVQAFTELANGCGYDVIETPAPTREPGQEV